MALLLASCLTLAWFFAEIKALVMTPVKYNLQNCFKMVLNAYVTHYGIFLEVNELPWQIG